MPRADRLTNAARRRIRRDAEWHERTYHDRELTERQRRRWLQTLNKFYQWERMTEHEWRMEDVAR